MQLHTIIAVNLTLGVSAVAVMLGSVRSREAVSRDTVAYSTCG